MIAEAILLPKKDKTTDKQNTYNSPNPRTKVEDTEPSAVTTAIS